MYRGLPDAWIELRNLHPFFSASNLFARPLSSIKKVNDPSVPGGVSNTVRSLVLSASMDPGHRAITHDGPILGARRLLIRNVRDFYLG